MGHGIYRVHALDLSVVMRVSMERGACLSGLVLKQVMYMCPREVPTRSYPPRHLITARRGSGPPAQQVALTSGGSGPPAEEIDCDEMSMGGGSYTRIALKKKNALLQKKSLAVGLEPITRRA